MMLLRIFELVFVVLYIGFLITEVFIPMAKSLPLFPSFRDDTKKPEPKEKKQ